jgi:glutathionylspermidine synthase
MLEKNFKCHHGQLADAVLAKLWQTFPNAQKLLQTAWLLKIE